MTCPICDGEVDATLFNVEPYEDDNAIRINYECPWCRNTLHAEITSSDFW